MMYSRNLFRSAAITWVLQSPWRLAALAALSVVLVWSTLSKERSREEWSWQMPIEPPGVTILSKPPQVLPAPVVKSPEVAGKPPAPVADIVSALPTEVQGAADGSAEFDVEVRQVIGRWSAAWSSRDMGVYLAQYARSFVPSGDQSRSEWIKTRYQRILSKKNISHEVRDLEVTRTGDTATAHFEQIYVADHLRQTGRKTLRLQREAGEWRIISESSN